VDRKKWDLAFQKKIARQSRRGFLHGKPQSVAAIQLFGQDLFTLPSQSDAQKNEARKDEKHREKVKQYKSHSGSSKENANDFQVKSIHDEGFMNLIYSASFIPCTHFYSR
jgi:hypothetical protein